MAKLFDTKTAAEMMGFNERSVRRLCESGKLVGARKVGGQWVIPITADFRLLKQRIIGSRIDPDEVKKIPKPKLDKAIRKYGLITKFEKYAGQQVRKGSLRTVAMQKFCKDEDLDFGTFKRWLKRHKEKGIIGLVDNRGGNRFETISPDAFEEFKRLYLDERQLSIKQCLRIIKSINSENNRGWKIPNYSAMCRYVEKEIPNPAIVLHRKGEAAYTAECSPYVLVDHKSIEPGAIWVGDHHQFNCMILHRGNWVRPWITAWLDMRSRTIVGWHVCLAPNQTTIMQAMKPAIKRYGPPEMVKIDNGKDYDSEMFTGETKTKRKKKRVLNSGYLDKKILTGLYAMMGIEISFAIAYHPQAKNIERWFDTLDQQFCKSFPTYCGKDTMRKPDGLNDYLNSDRAIQEAYNLEDFSEKVKEYVTTYNNMPHSGEGMNGRTPFEVMSTRNSKRVILNSSLEYLLQVWSGEIKVGKNGVRFKNIYYGQYNIELMKYQGKLVRVSYDPDDIRELNVYDAKTWKFITVAKQANLILYHSPVSEQMLRDAMRTQARIKRVHRQYRGLQRTLFMDLTELTKKALEDSAQEPPKPKQVASVKPVETPIDSEANAVKKRHIQLKLKRAVGAEKQETAIDLGIDWDLLNKKKKPEKSLKLFDFDSDSAFYKND